MDYKKAPIYKVLAKEFDKKDVDKQKAQLEKQVKTAFRKDRAALESGADTHENAVDDQSAVHANLEASLQDRVNADKAVAIAQKNWDLLTEAFESKFGKNAE